MKGGLLMANVLQIEYQYRDQKTLTEFIRQVACTDVNVEWDTQKCQIRILWHWGQEVMVRELLNLIKDRFKEFVVTIQNEDFNLQVSKVHAEAQVEIATDTPTMEEEVPEIVQEDVSQPAAVEEVIVQSEEEVISDEHVAEEKSPAESANTPEGSDTTPDLNELLEKLVGERMGEYDFAFNPEIAATDLCMDLGIKSEIIRLALALCTKCRTEKQLLQSLARVQQKNQALVNAELRGSFNKWLKTEYPDVLRDHPKVSVMNFLNIFREEHF